MLRIDLNFSSRFILHWAKCLFCLTWWAQNRKGSEVPQRSGKVTSTALAPSPCGYPRLPLCLLPCRLLQAPPTLTSSHVPDTSQTMSPNPPCASTAGKDTTAPHKALLQPEAHRPPSCPRSVDRINYFHGWLGSHLPLTSQPTFIIKNSQ